MDQGFIIGSNCYIYILLYIFIICDTLFLELYIYSVKPIQTEKDSCKPTSNWKVFDSCGLLLLFFVFFLKS